MQVGPPHASGIRSEIDDGRLGSNDKPILPRQVVSELQKILAVRRTRELALAISPSNPILAPSTALIDFFGVDALGLSSFAEDSSSLPAGF